MAERLFTIQRASVQFSSVPSRGGRGCERKKGDVDKGFKNHLKMKCRRINDERVGEGRQGPESKESKEVFPVAEDSVRGNKKATRGLQGAP